MGSFKPYNVSEHEPYSTVSHERLSLYVSASTYNMQVRVGATHDDGGASFRITPDRARELAAELIAAADSLQTVAEAA